MALERGALVQRRYRLERALAGGGMGTTYLARDEVLDREVALKLLGEGGDGPMLEAMRAEFSRLAGVVHPHLARVYDFGVARVGAGAGEARAFYTSVVVAGAHLDRFADARSLDEVARALLGVVDALAELHRLGFVHGDVKPANVLVEDGGRAVLLDLGCSRAIGAIGSVSGTPSYVAPELLAGAPADAAIDAFALGVTMREVATRRLLSRLRRLAGRLTRVDPSARPSLAEVREELASMCAARGAARSAIRARPKAPLVTSPPRLVGRDAEVAAFRRTLEALERGSDGPRAICLVGDEGAGRTRLLDELRWTAELDGVEVVEGDARSPRALTSMIERASGEAVPDGIAGVAVARKVLDGLTSPTALFLDDADALDPVQQALLASLARTATRRAPWLLAWVGPVYDGDATARLDVGPLGARDVAAWASACGATVLPSELAEKTRGHAASIERALAGRDGDGDARALSVRATAAFAALTAAGRRAVSACAVIEGSLDTEAARALGVDEIGASEAVAARFVVAEDGRLRLARAADASALRAATHRATRRTLELAAAEHAGARAVPGGAAAAASAAARVLHLTRAGALERANAELATRTSELDAWPDAWCAATRALAEASPTAAALVRAAEVHEAAGRAREALSLFARVLAARPVRGVRVAARVGASGALLKLGYVARAERILDAALASSSIDLGDDLRARALDRASRVAIRRGAWARAAAFAERGLTIAPAADVKADLLDDLAVASSYAGDTTRARDALAKAAAAHAELDRPRARARHASYAALIEYRAGAVAAAARGFREALAIAEGANAADLAANAALNLATASHQAGDLGEALGAYEHALALAIALDRRSSEVTLRANLAKLHADLGLADRAEITATAAAAAARAEGMVQLVGAAEAALGDARLVRGDAAGASAAYAAARAAFEASGAARELLELGVQAAEATLRAGDVRAATDALDAILEDPRATGDVGVRARLARARLLIARGRAEEGNAELDHAEADAHASGQRALVAELEGSRADAFDALGAHVRARRHAAIAEDLWERAAVDLPADVLAAYWRHPLRVGRRASTERPRDVATERRAERLERLVDVNKKLSASLEVAPILGFTIDHALELTDAERGFVLLARRLLPLARGEAEAPLDDTRAAELEIAASRNADPTPAGARDVAFSRSIAARVVASGAPIVTLDAEGDRRFAGNASIHAMRLKSVLCVPIRAAEGVIGALYVDHRFRRDLFDDGAVDVLLAFADQVAIALTNARLHAELARRTAELDVERARIQALLEGQAATIGRLTEEVREKQAALERRYDYANLVGDGPAMQAVFVRLDRIVEAQAPVLVEGESGAGKELVARAIHFHGPRKAGPFVAVNCGALPDALLESELFGHVRGAFTGAVRDRDGLFVAARGGTIFLDELGETSPAMQVKLLRVLQEREVVPVGARAPVAVDARVVCATNKDLRAEVAAGRFRADLYYRVAVVEVRLPALRERVEDLPALATHLLARAAASLGREPPRLDRLALRALAAYAWPGNVRELENVLTKAALLADGDVIRERDLALPTARGRRDGPRVPATRAEFGQREDERVLAALEACKWNVVAASAALGVPRATLYRRLARLGASRPDARTRQA